MEDFSSEIQALFRQAYVIGGSPCCGKSTITERLSARLEIQYYKVDDYEFEHLDRCDPEQQPLMARYAQMSWDEIWMRPPTLQVEEEFHYYRERFALILEDLRAYDLSSPILLEGTAYLPELIHRCGVGPGRALYMVPTKEFQLKHYQKRTWIQRILNQCRDPEQAYANWMERDYLFGREILRQAEKFGYRTIEVDGRLGLEEQLEEVRKHFGLPS
jgi:2-phosphoglycerate kinase